MRPTYHILFTILIFIVLTFFYPFPLKFLIYALILTFMIDVLEHGQVILHNNAEANTVKRLLFSGKFLKAYKFYYVQRHKAEAYTLFHNFLFLTLIILFSIFIYPNIVIFLGVIFHLLTDLIYDLITKKKLHPSWYLNLIKT